MTKQHDDADNGEWLTRAEAAKYVSLSVYWLHKHAHTGKSPIFVTIGNKSYYRRSDLDDWVRSPKASAVGTYAPGGQNHRFTRRGLILIARKKLMHLMSDEAKLIFADFESTY